MKGGLFLLIAGAALLWFSSRAKAATGNGSTATGNGATADPDAGSGGSDPADGTPPLPPIPPEFDVDLDPQPDPPAFEYSAPAFEYSAPQYPEPYPPVLDQHIPDEEPDEEQELGWPYDPRDRMSN